MTVKKIFFIIFLLIGVPFQIDAKFVLYQLTGISGKKKISVHRTLRDCLESGRQFQSIECSLIWKKTKSSKSDTLEEAVRNHIMNVCNQDGM